MCASKHVGSISGLVVEYIVAIDVTRVRFPADAYDVCVEKAARRKAVQKGAASEKLSKINNHEK